MENSKKNMNTKEKIGQRINGILGIKKISQKELADYLGVKPNQISYFCSGDRTPNTQQLIMIADFLNVSTDYLLGRTKTPTIDENIQVAHKTTGLSGDAVTILQKMNLPLDIEEDEVNGILEKQKRYSEAIYIHPQDYVSAAALEVTNEIPTPLSKKETDLFHMIMQHITNTKVLEIMSKAICTETDKENETYAMLLFKNVYDYCKKDFAPIEYKQNDEGGVFYMEISVETQKNAILLEINKIIQEFADKIKESADNG